MCGCSSRIGVQAMSRYDARTYVARPDYSSLAINEPGKATDHAGHSDTAGDGQPAVWHAIDMIDEWWDDSSYAIAHSHEVKHPIY